MSSGWRPPLSVSVLAVPAVIGAIRLVAASQRSFDFFGDEAILESAVRHVGEQLVGPYSRFGFHQPGPAYYYLQAPFYRLPGASAAALFLGAYCINVGAALGCVAVVRRFLGEPAARWAAAVVGLLLLCLTPRLLADPWNPYVLAVPVLLAVLLAAAGTRSPAAAGGAAVVGSYVVQTHVAATATLGAVFATAAIVGLVRHRRIRRQPQAEAPRHISRARRWRAPATTALVLVALWTPPLIDQATRTPGNLLTLARFFRASHPQFDQGIDHGLDHTAGQVAAQLTVVPFGHDRDARPADAPKMLLALSGMAASAVVALVGLRRRDTVIASLGAVSVVGPLAAVWSGTRIVGEVFPYLLLWTSGLPLAGAIGAATLLNHRWQLGRLLAGAVTVVGVALTVVMARNPLPPYPTVTDVAAACRLAAPWLEDRRIEQVRIRIVDHDRWPLATGVAVRLEKEGFTTTADPEWTPLFGEHFHPTGHEQATVWIANAGSTAPAATSPTRLGVVGGASVWASSSVAGDP